MNETDKIVDKQIEEEVKHSFLDYSMSVITSRAIPDARDGMKPVHRRILYSMYEQKMDADGGHYKSARIVGDVIGKYHPHGDSSVYEALVRMAQPWSQMATLADGQGNFGSMDGDSAAAMRYTEAKMSKISEELMKEIKKNNVPFRDNYDGRNKEPAVLPARFPNLLVNGGQGIAVAMASNMPTHNLAEVCDTAIRYIKNPDLTVEELMETLPAPDFPTGGKILGNEGIIEAYKTGRGSFVVRGSVQIEEMDGGFAVVITQIPYQVTKATLKNKIKEIQKLADEHKRKTRSRSKRHFMADKPARALDFIRRDGVSDESDAESKEDDIRIVIQLKDGIDPRVVINHLYKYTPLQTSFSINNTALIPRENGGLRPKCLSLKELLEQYVKHQIEVITKEVNFDLDRHQKDLHQTEALIKALGKLDDTIDVIRDATNNEEAIEGLMNLLAIDKEQAVYILDKKIRTLSGYQQSESQDKYNFLIDEVKRLEEIVSDEDKVKEIIISELERIKDSYGRERRTELRPPANELSEEDLIQNEQVVVTLSKNGYIKSTKEDRYKNQRRNGRGVSTMNLDKDDLIFHLEVMYKHDDLLIFTNYGKVYQLKGYDIPETSTASKGIHIHNILPGIDDDEVIQSVVSVKVFSETQYLFFTTSKGTVKKTPLSDYENIRRTGIIAINLEKDDRLVNVSLTDGDANIILVTRDGKSISFNEKDVRKTSRDTLGVRGIRLAEKDYVVSADIHESFGDLFIITENGYGKKTSLEQFKIQNRGGSGVIALKSNEKTGKIVSTLVVTEDDSVYILSSQGAMIKIYAKQLSRFNRAAQGTKVINLRENDKVKTTARRSFEEETEENEDISHDDTN